LQTKRHLIFAKDMVQSPNPPSFKKGEEKDNFLGEKL
jgi:hypothetical protein